MKFISEAVAKWQLERLETLVTHLRSRAKSHKLRSTSIVCEHLNLADDLLDEAISAMKYHRYDQAAYSCQAGFVQLGLAELLLNHAAKVDAGVKAVAALTNEKDISEEEQLTAYLASCLAEMKVAIEYSNCKVSTRAHTVLDQAMDYYNDALKAVKQSSPDKCKRSSQSGLLCLLLASELISSENMMPLPGWRGLSNPMHFGSLRRACELSKHLAESRVKLHEREKLIKPDSRADEKDRVIFLRKNWEKAYTDFLSAANSNAQGTTSHAQALIKSAIRNLEACIELMNIDDPSEFNEEMDELTEPGLREPVTDIATEIKTIKQILEERKIARKDHIINMLDSILRLYKDAYRNFEKSHFVRAEKSISDAMLELDFVRQQIQLKKNRSTKEHSVKTTEIGP